MGSRNWGELYVNSYFLGFVLHFVIDVADK